MAHSLENITMEVRLDQDEEDEELTTGGVSLRMTRPVVGYKVDKKLWTLGTCVAVVMLKATPASQTRDQQLIGHVVNGLLTYRSR